MANLTDADLDSQLVDLTTLPLSDLRQLNTSALVEAMRRMRAAAEFTTGTELQDQRSWD